MKAGETLQTLTFESAWDKAICAKDRQMVTKRFDQIHHLDGLGFVTTYLNHTYNHRKALLVTVLLHNYMDEPLSLVEKTITLISGEKKIATYAFSLPFTIPATTSMPWTFIFPARSYREIHVDEKVQLQWAD
jgi:SLAP domain-containing protein